MPDFPLGTRRSLVTDKAAEADLIGIWIYSFEYWGEAQADVYLDALEQGVRAIVSAPASGRHRDELRDGYWSIAVERHVVFYTFDETTIRIRRVLHEVMDIDDHL